MRAIFLFLLAPPTHPRACVRVAVQYAPQQSAGLRSWPGCGRRSSSGVIVFGTRPRRQQQRAPGGSVSNASHKSTVVLLTSIAHVRTAVMSPATATASDVHVAASRTSHGGQCSHHSRSKWHSQCLIVRDAVVSEIPPGPVSVPEKGLQGRPTKHVGLVHRVARVALPPGINFDADNEFLRANFCRLVTTCCVIKNRSSCTPRMSAQVPLWRPFKLHPAIGSRWPKRVGVRF